MVGGGFTTEGYVLLQNLERRTSTTLFVTWQHNGFSGSLVWVAYPVNPVLFFLLLLWGFMAIKNRTGRSSYFYYIISSLSCLVVEEDPKAAGKNVA